MFRWSRRSRRIRQEFPDITVPYHVMTVEDMEVMERLIKRGYKKHKLETKKIPYFINPDWDTRPFHPKPGYKLLLFHLLLGYTTFCLFFLNSAFIWPLSFWYIFYLTLSLIVYMK